MFRYGTYWIFVVHLEGVREVMRTREEDTQFMDLAISNGYRHMAKIHAQVQERVQQFHLLLGYCLTMAMKN